MSFESNYPQLIQFLSYFIVGVWNTLFDFGIWQTLVILIKPNSKFSNLLEKYKLNRYSFAHATAFLIASFVSYFLNKYFVFANSENKSSASFPLFMLVSFFSLGITTFYVNFMTKNEAVLRIAAKNKYVHKFWPQFAKITAALISLFTNFFGYKFMVFI